MTINCCEDFRNGRRKISDPFDGSDDSGFFTLSIYCWELKPLTYWLPKMQKVIFTRSLVVINSCLLNDIMTPSETQCVSFKYRKSIGKYFYFVMEILSCTFVRPIDLKDWRVDWIEPYIIAEFDWIKGDGLVIDCLDIRIISLSTSLILSVCPWSKFILYC